MAEELLVGTALPKIIGRGRPKGVGKNLKLLDKLKIPDSCLWDLSFNRMRSILVSAQYAGIKLRVRKLDDEPMKRATYAIWRLNP